MKMNSVNKKKLIGQLNIYRSVLILLVICVFATILSPSFLSVANLFNVFKQITVAGIVGCGMTFVILTGGIDLSVGSILGLAGVLASGILESTGNAGAAILVALAVGIGCGAVNGFFVAVCEIPPFISTLGMMTLLRGCILVYTKGSPIPIKVDAYKFFGKGTVAGVPVPVIILIILFLIAHYVLTQTSYGRSIYAFGGNREAARLSGIAIDKMKIKTYMLTGLLCGVSGMMLAGRLNFTNSTMATGAELSCIVAGVVGGTSMNGGSGSVWGTLIGSLLMGVINNGLNLLNVSQFWQSVAMGALVILAVAVDSFRQASQNKVKKEA